MMRYRYLLLYIVTGICTLLLSLFNDIRPTLGVVPAVVTNRYDNFRAGANLNETVLKTTNVDVNVDVNQFGKLFERPVLGDIYAQPLYVSGVIVPGNGFHNVVYVATAHNMVYAFDADDPTPAGNVPLWQRDLSYLGPVFSENLFINDIWGMELGVLSTPVIDLATQTMYLVSEHSCGGGCAAHYLHALNITTGADQMLAVEILASVPGTGDGSVGGVIDFQSFIQLQRPGLLLLNGKIFIAFGSTNDRGTYHGWVMSYSAANLQQVSVFNTTPDGYAGGIWQSGTGISTDGQSLYVVTGNGTFDVDTGGRDYGDSIIRLRQDLTIASYFTPFNQDDLSAQDLDLGINGAMLLPGTSLALSGSKQGILYVVNRASMGGFHPLNDNQIVQNFPAANGHMHSTPVFWNGPNGLNLYIWTEQDYPKAFRYTGGGFNTTPVSTGQIQTEGMPAGILSLSASGTTAGTGILWGTRMQGTGTNGIGVLHAFDATVYPDGIMRELWNSERNSARDRVGIIAKFDPPMVANGKVYVGSFSDKLNVYGLLSNNPTSSSGAAPVRDFYTTHTPTLTWNRVTPSIGYTLQIDNAADFVSPLYTIDIPSPSTLSYLTPWLTNGTYYWRVCAKITATTCGNWSHSQSFVISA